MEPPTPRGYDASDIEQHGNRRVCRITSSDCRTPFQHDVDRILYSTEFRALAGKTQVIASDQLGGYHNRLTHSLKVAQISKRMAVMLTQRLIQATGERFVGPNPDLMEATGLLHDIGHPPFGHIGETAIRTALAELADKEGLPRQGFQANAQNLRIVTHLAIKQERSYLGLNLTRAALDSAVKYPWEIGTQGYGKEHWGCYPNDTDREALRWTLGDPNSPYPSPDHHPDPLKGPRGQRRPIEEQLMDWADEVTYACHDVEDFYRAGLLPLDQILSGTPSEDDRPGEPALQMGFETKQFVDYLVKQHGFTEDRAVVALQKVRNRVGTLYRFEDTRDGRGRSTSAISSLIAHFMGPKPAEPRDDEPDTYGLSIRPLDDTGYVTRYHAGLEVDPILRDSCTVLTKLIWFYVIDRPSLASQQHGQARILKDLVEWFATEPSRTLPTARKEELEEHGDVLRAAADAAASLTEAEAVRLHRRMSGIDWGQITDLA